MGRITTSLVGNANLITKVYFPRVLIPLSGLAGSLVDFAFSFLILIAMMAWYHIAPTSRLLALSRCYSLRCSASFALGLWLAALNVRYRDITYVVPFVLQIWLYASPVGYPTTAVPERWRWIYGLNPLVGVIEGFRWALLGVRWQPGTFVVFSTVGVVVGAVAALWYFQRTEDSFADIV